MENGKVKTEKLYLCRDEREPAASLQRIPVESKR